MHSNASVCSRERVLTTPSLRSSGYQLKKLVFHTKRHAETARRLVVETWLQRNGVITVTQNKKVLPVFLEQFAHD
jgi:hypothetical protein